MQCWFEALGLFWHPQDPPQGPPLRSSRALRNSQAQKPSRIQPTVPKLDDLPNFEVIMQKRWISDFGTVFAAARAVLGSKIKGPVFFIEPGPLNSFSIYQNRLVYQVSELIPNLQDGSYISVIGTWLLGVPCNLWGPPRAPMRSLTSRDTHPPGLVLLLVQLGKFADFWGRLCSLQFQCCNNHHHCHRGRGGGGRSAICSQRPQIFSTLSQKLNFT